jgi:hypothetical protein
VVQKRTEQTAVIVLITARYANNLDIDRKATNANSVATSAAHQANRIQRMRQHDTQKRYELRVS